MYIYWHLVFGGRNEWIFKLLYKIWWVNIYIYLFIEDVSEVTPNILSLWLEKKSELKWVVFQNC